MLRSRWQQTGWQGASLVAITYVHFLIFAQFAFLNRLASLGLAGAHLKAVMAAMAIGGISFSLFAPSLNRWLSPNLRACLGLLVSSMAAFLSLLPLNFTGSLCVSFLVGAGLGLLTVTLVTHLRKWTGNQNPLLLVGLGTGTGYLVCNIPAFFTAPPQMQTLAAGLLCLVGICITLLPSPELRDEQAEASQSTIPYPLVLASFAALVWLDSAAFFIIQHTLVLKADTWQGTLHLCSNGMLHLGAAFLSVWLLRRRGLSFTLATAIAALGVACLLLLESNRVLIASIFYPIGVSLYSVALVAYPALLAPAASIAERGRKAGWIYAIAGWFGSAMGIGMGQNLGHVPTAFVFVAGAVVLLPGIYWLLRHRTRELAITALVALTALSISRVLQPAKAPTALSQVERGRQVYISEGCIHCHSQYIRPNSSEVLIWGPVESIQELRLQHPPLIGNRRQGPDLSQVGGRRSALWLKAHFYNPAEVSGSSIMPTFSILFRNSRGDDLVMYLQSLNGSGTKEHQNAERQWKPSPDAMRAGDSELGEHLFQQDCATCHLVDGQTRRQWKSSFKRIPPNLALGPFFYLPPSGPEAQRLIRLAQITKFGIPGTDMPGHEYLSDKEIASISLWLSHLTAQSNQEQ